MPARWLGYIARAVTYTEPERLALDLQRLLERRTKLREIVRGAIAQALTEEERSEIRRVLDHVETEIAMLEQRLKSLGRTPDAR